ncbi:hypothetical protein ABET09_14950 [Priestia megaterium]
MKKLQSYNGWDTHLDSWIEKLNERQKRVGEDTHDGLKMVWMKKDIIDFTGWTNSNYTKRGFHEKKERLHNMGVALHELTGKGDATQAVVTIQNYAWYYLLLRGKGQRSKVTEAYLDNIFTGTGYLNLGGMNIAATLAEFAEVYAEQFGETVSAVSNKLDRLRSNIKPYGYILSGKESSAKQIRVKVRESETWLKGPRAIFLDQKLRREYADFYLDLDQKVPYRKTDSLRMRLQAKKLRQDMTVDFTNHLKKQYSLDLIRSHRSSTISPEGCTDYTAIVALYMMGATFPEIRSFLEERPVYWQEQDNKNKTPGKTIDEILEELL